MPSSVKGVRVSCHGDISVLGADKFIPVDVSISDPVWTADKSVSSAMVGVPVRVRRFPAHPAWKDDRQSDVYSNQEITLLFRAMDPEQQDDFSLAPMSWQNTVGSVLVVRDDGKDMTPQQVEALCYYNLQHTTDMFQDAWEHLSLTGSNKEMVKLVGLFTPQKFGEFFLEFKAKKVEEDGDASWVTAVSPV
ncbi:MAG: hypothetical protein ASARMPREDX12_005125 [Alectoria sarmentosa]|nr:MAG: hypothetical protein ASARMPREDX12_005125 [Alectoria sarmentosa]